MSKQMKWTCCYPGYWRCGVWTAEHSSEGWWLHREGDQEVEPVAELCSTLAAAKLEAAIHELVR